MTAVIRTTLAAIAALAPLALCASPAEARAHHHHHPAAAAAAPASHASRHHHAKAADTPAHAHSAHKHRHRAAGVSHGRSKHAQREVVPHPHERHAALCQVVTVHHRSVERCRGG